MAYDEALADRVRGVLRRRRRITERKMFGGIAFLRDGHMFCGVLGRDLVLRLGDRGAAEALGRPHTKAMDFTGKPMKSMVYVKPKGFESDDALREWVERALAFGSSLPAKKPPARST